MLHLLLGTARGRRRWLVAGLLLAGLLLALWTAARSDRFSLSSSLTDFTAAQAQRGYVLVGRFGQQHWPAMVVEVVSGEDGVAFVSADGQLHQYEGFKGAMKALTLRPLTRPGSAFTLVLLQRPTHRDPGRAALER